MVFDWFLHFVIIMFFPCTECKKVFAADFSLGQHIRTVHKIKKFITGDKRPVSASAASATSSSVSPCVKPPSPKISRTIANVPAQVYPCLDLTQDNSVNSVSSPTKVVASEVLDLTGDQEAVLPPPKPVKPCASTRPVIHTGPVSCNYCGFVGSTLAQKLHFERAHKLKSVAFICHICKSLSFNGHALLQHMRENHQYKTTSLQGLQFQTRCIFQEYIYIPTCVGCNYSTFNIGCECPHNILKPMPLNQMAGVPPFELDLTKIAYQVPKEKLQAMYKDNQSTKTSSVSMTLATTNSQLFPRPPVPVLKPSTQPRNKDLAILVSAQTILSSLLPKAPPCPFAKEIGDLEGVVDPNLQKFLSSEQ